MRVLIIEDSDLWIPLMVSGIEEAGHEPTNPGLTKSPEQALEFIREHNPDMILLDMNYSDKARMDQFADGCQVVYALEPELRKKVICASATPDAYISILRPLGVRHFGGKENFRLCLGNTCQE